MTNIADQLRDLSHDWSPVTRTHEILVAAIEEIERLRGPVRTSEAIDWSLSSDEIAAQYRAMAQQVDEFRADAERYRWAIENEDNAYELAAVVMSWGSDKSAIDELIDEARAKESSNA